MNNVVPFTSATARLQKIEEQATIVFASFIHDAFAKYCEAPNDDAFSSMLFVLCEDLRRDIATTATLRERYIWSVAQHVATGAGEDIDREFCRAVDLTKHHAPALKWAREYLAGLPARYSENLGGAHA